MPTENRKRGKRPGSQTAPATGRSTAADARRSMGLSRRDWSGGWTNPIERFFNSFGLGAAGNRIGAWNMWNPELEMFQRGDELVIRLDLPGMEKDDVTVEVTDEAIIVQGERRDELEDEREGVYRSERTYGSFYRVIPLPEGAITDNIQASFKNGVLEITMPAPPREAQRGRRIEIGSGT